MNTPVAPVVDTTICSGCGRCVSACPLRLITLEVSGYRKTAVVRNVERCTGCRECVDICLLKALIASEKAFNQAEGNQRVAEIERCLTAPSKSPLR